MFEWMVVLTLFQLKSLEEKGVKSNYHETFSSNSLNTVKYLHMYHGLTYLAIMSTLSDGIEPVSIVCSWFTTQTTNRLQVLQTKECELFSVFFASHRVIPASVLPERFAGPLQYRVHHHLIHGTALPAQRTVVWPATVLYGPAVQQAGFTESVSASEQQWLTENMSTNWTCKVIVKLSASGGHCFSQGLDDKAESQRILPPRSTGGATLS